MLQCIPHSLRFRFFAVLGGLLICAILALAAISTWFIFPALQAEERATVKRELDRIERSFHLDQQQLLTEVRDWAHWDDTYQFIQGNYPGYTDTNFSLEMFEDMRYQLMAFFTSAGEVFFLAGINPVNGQYQTCKTPTNNCAWMAPWVTSMQASIVDDDVVKNAIYANTGSIPALVAANPILRTDETGPVKGWLFKMRFMSADWVNFMQEYTGLKIALNLYPNTSPRPDTFLFSGNKVHAERYFPISGILTTSSLALGIDLNRTSYLTSLTTFRYVLMWTAVLMVIVIVFVLVLLEKIVLKPLRLLTQFTQQVDMSEPDVRKLTKRDDEIGLLARTFREQLTHQQQLNAELLNLSTHDALTGLPNRRLFDQHLETAFAEAVSSSTPLAVIMLDIDHFKLYNDHYGHPKGDKCLQQVANAFNSVSADFGFLIARTGGEEFSAILPGVSPSLAKEIGEQLKLAVDRLQLPHATSPVQSFVTISVGIALKKCSKAQKPSTIMSAADQALYLAKASGRHQVVLSNAKQLST